MTCQYCTAETTNGLALCAGCRKTAQHALSNIVAYFADLALVPTGSGGRRGTSSTPDPTGLAAASIQCDPVTEADDEATNTLTTWARCLIDDRPNAGRPPRTVPDLAPWLAQRLDSIATLGWAGQFLREVLGVERKLKAVAARARVGQYLGVCGNELTEVRRHDETSCWCACHLGATDCDVPSGCGREYAEIAAEVCTRDLFAGREERLVRCRCGAHWDVQARRQQLVRAAEDQLAPVSVIARLAAAFTGEASVGKIEDRLRKWVQRKRIHAVTTQVIDGRPRKVYRVGDVLDLLADTPEKLNETKVG